MGCCFSDGFLMGTESPIDFLYLLREKEFPLVALIECSPSFIDYYCADFLGVILGSNILGVYSSLNDFFLVW
jgi:hypothetical protein